MISVGRSQVFTAKLYAFSVTARALILVSVISVFARADGGGSDSADRPDGPSIDQPRSNIAASAGAAIESSLGSKRGDPNFRPDADLNGDGVINVLDAAISRSVDQSRRAAADQSGSAGNAIGPIEQIIIEPTTAFALPDGTISVLFLIQDNNTPLLGYSLDVELVPVPGSTGSVTADVESTNFFLEQNLIASGCTTLDPFFSVIQAADNDGVFVNAISEDNATCLAVDDVNDVLAQVFFDVGTEACGDFSIELGAASALSDGDAFSVPFGFSAGTISVVCIAPPLRADPPHDILKNRYISIDPRGAGQTNPSSLHIRVMVDNSQVNGQAGSGPWWAGQPNAACISVVTTTKPAVEPDWTGCDTAHLTGCPIIPTTTYALAAEASGGLSADALFDTQAKPGIKWHGDCVGFFTGTEWTAPNGQTSIDDVVAANKTFQNPSATPGCGTPPCNATHTSVTDMEPNLPGGPQINQIVNIADVFTIILGFQGFEYPGPDLTQCQ